MNVLPLERIPAVSEAFRITARSFLDDVTSALAAQGAGS